MLKRRLMVICCLMAIGPSLFAQGRNDSVFDDKALQSLQVISVQENKTILLEKIISKHPVYLFIFLSPECPLSQQYTRVLNELSASYHGRVRAVGVFPGKSYSVKTIRRFISDYKLVYPAIIDQDKKLTLNLQGTVTPEVIALNEQFELVYKGAIDNLVKDLGQKKIKATQHYLKDAIEQTLLNQEVALKRTTAVGCLINDY